jgi:alanine-synthesizing transaminase
MSEFVFAKRTDWEVSHNALTQSRDDVQSLGGSIIDLTISNPTQCGFSDLPSRWLSDLANPANACYDPDPRGLSAAREAVVRYYADYGVCVSPENIFLTSSTSEGYSYVFRLLADAGQRILFPCPGYPLFRFLGDLNDVALDFYGLDFIEGRWEVDRESVLSEIKPETRAVVVVNPNNPTGSYCGREDQDFLRGVCGKTMALISDEVFFDYALDGTSALTMAQESGVLTFVLSGLSKILAMPQMKMSWIVVTGPLDVTREARRRLEIIADTYLSVNSPVQNAAVSWLDQRREVQSEILTRVHHNLEALTIALVGTGATVYPVEGGWSAVVDLPEGTDEEEFILKLLNRYHVMTYPGYFFDFPRAAPRLVLSLLVSSDVWSEGLNAIRECLLSGKG